MTAIIPKAKKMFRVLFFNFCELTANHLKLMKRIAKCYPFHIINPHR